MPEKETSTSLGQSIPKYVLPLSLIGSLIVLLVLILNSSSLVKLKAAVASSEAGKIVAQEEYDLANQRLVVVKGELASSQSALSALMEQKTAALDTIGQAEAASSTLKRLRDDAEASLADAKRQQKSLAESLDQIRTATAAAEEDGRRQRSSVASDVAQLRQEQEAARRVLDEQRNTVSQMDADLAQKQKDLTLAQTKAGAVQLQLAEADAQIKDREAKLRVLSEKLNEREQLLAKRSGEIGSLEANAQALTESITKNKSEVDALNQQIVSLRKVKADASENERLRAERAALTARISLLQDEASALAATVKSAEKARRDMEGALADLKLELKELQQKRTALAPK